MSMNLPDCPKGKLRILYCQILDGSAVCETTQFGKGYVKHMGVKDSTDIERMELENFERAKSEGINTEEQQIEYLIKEKLWTKELETELTDNQSMLHGLQDSRSKLFLESQIKGFDKQIEEVSLRINRLSTERKELIGLTAETYASKKVNEYYVTTVLFKEKDFKEKLVSDDQFNDLSDTQVVSLIKDYNAVSKYFHGKNFKRIAVSQFMLNFYYLCKENPFTFFGKPVVDLTFYQSEIFSYARYFAHQLTECKVKPTAEMMDDPDQLIDFFSSSQNAEEVLKKLDQDGEKGGGSSIVGATKKDLEKLGIKQSDTGVNLSELAAKKGGRLTMEDFMEIHKD